ncbi:uncharacterized protein K02A2.6-like [Topomyia yanbarensis]|uniref:uncharacterized protein K02A2.6-like n=1 Tax=Topomyia yanbarensis TaxID=2498891 RepID=UPI00273C1E01|nr:uncharacterized protein K02A2.6-like [Topomyia yanbarensis]
MPNVQRKSDGATIVKRVLQQLHKGHPGVERMRSITRQYVYWPNIDEDVSKLVKACNACADVVKTDRKTNLESWPVPKKPWQRIHLDYAGPIKGQYYLILVDSFSKWPEVIQTKDITSVATLRMLRGVFARFGAPETLVTDNGTQFTSEQLEKFCHDNAILHLKTAPFHPQSNGLAERFVDTFKRALRKISAKGGTVDEAIDTFLLCYRSTPCRNAPDLPLKSYLADPCESLSSYCVHQLCSVRKLTRVKRNNLTESTVQKLDIINRKIPSGRNRSGVINGTGKLERLLNE